MSTTTNEESPPLDPPVSRELPYTPQDGVASECDGTIELDCSEVAVGDRVGINWDIPGLDNNLLSERDYIGMFEANEGGTPIEIDSLIDSRLRGCNSAHAGHLTWLIEGDKFKYGTTRVCFCYYDNLNVLRARSSTLTVTNPIPSQSAAPVAKQRSEDTPVAIANPVHRQASDPQGTSTNRLDEIRQTLYGRGLRPRSSLGHRRHSSLYTALRSHDRTCDESHDLTTSMVLPPPPPLSSVDPLTESLPPDWEVRTGASGTLVYYDHKHKVVKLDRPRESGGSGTLPRFEDFLRRSDLNVMQRQLSNPSYQSTNQKTRITRSHTVIGAVRDHEHHHPQPDQPVIKPVIPVSNTQPVEGEIEEETASEREVSGEVERRGENGELKQDEPVDGSDLETTLQQQELVQPVVIQVKPASGAQPEGETEISNEHTPRTSTTNEESDLERERKTGVHEREGGGGGEVERMFSREDSIDDELRHSPGFQFITRPDLYKFAKEEHNEEFFNNLAVLELIQTIRSDHSLFAKYRHSSKLVKVINTFARTECDLPAGWEKKVDPKTGKHVFVDHNTRQTSYIDPRLPYHGNDLNLTSSDTKPGLLSRSRPFISETVSAGQTSRPRLPSSFTPPTSEQTRNTRSASFSVSSQSSSVAIPVRPLVRSTTPPPPPPPSLLTPPPPPPPPPVLPSAGGTQNSSHSYSDRVVMFLRQPNIFELLRSRNDSSLSINIMYLTH